MSFPCGSAGKESGCSAGDLGFILGLGISPSINLLDFFSQFLTFKYTNKNCDCLGYIKI